MILVDYNQVMLASLFASIGNHTNVELDENLIRHMFLNSIRFNRKKFHKEYGEIVLCCDNVNVWRRDYFPYYKANRKKRFVNSITSWLRPSIVVSEAAFPGVTRPRFTNVEQ